MDKEELQTFNFLNSLYGSINNGFLSIWTSGNKMTKWFSIKEIEIATREILNLRFKQDVYFGVGLRKEPLSECKRGTNKDVIYLPGVWLDIDLKDGAHAIENLPDLQQSKYILNAFALEPSIVIHSGGGLHCYWLFDSPVRTYSEHERNQATWMLKNFQNVFIEQAKIMKLHIDNTSDLARVLRVPGTYNYKQDIKKLVKIIKINTNLRYSLTELVNRIEETEKQFNFTTNNLKNNSLKESKYKRAVSKPIVENCNYIQYYLENKESASYTEWLAALSIGAFCENPEIVCNEWSWGHPKYTEKHTNRKIVEIKANMKPRTCASLSNEFGKCEGCIFKGKINSPIALGMKNEQRENKKTFKKTDLGNAERLIYRHGEDLRYCPPFGCWYIWDGIRWKKDILNEVEQLAKETIRSMYIEANNIEDHDVRQEIIKHAIRSESNRSISSMVNLAKSEKGIPILSDELDKNKWLLNCLNGTLNLKNGIFYSNRREDLITRVVPVHYDSKAECPTWLSFLEDAIKNEKGETNHNVIEFLQRAVGYSLTGDTREQVVFILFGDGDNGKSVFIGTIRGLLGEYANQTNTDTFMVRKNERINNDIASLKGSRLVSAVETEEGKKLAESLIKQLTGGELIQARFLRQEFFEFEPQFKIFLTTNHRPIISGTDKDIWRRIRLIPFTVKIKEEMKDKQLIEKLKYEYPGILRWALEGCLKWQLEDSLATPPEITLATNLYKKEMDVLEDFINESCVIEPNAEVTTKDFYMYYQNWCMENGEFILSRRKFIEKVKTKLASEGHIIYDKRFGVNSDRGYRGIGLNVKLKQ